MRGKVASRSICTFIACLTCWHHFTLFWQRRFEYFDVFDLIGSDKRKWPDDRIENCWTKKNWMKIKFKDLRVIDIIQIVPSKEDCKFKDMWVKIYLFPFPVCLPDLCSIFKIALYLTHISDIHLIYLYIWHILFYSVFCWQAKNGPLSFLPLPNILYLSYICWSFSVHDIC